MKNYLSKYEKTLNSLSKYADSCFASIDPAFTSALESLISEINLLSNSEIGLSLKLLAHNFEIIRNEHNISGIAESLHRLSSSLEKISYDLNYSSDDDYVILDETPIKELDISETIVVPIGNNRFRMKTSDLITLLSTIFTILLTISGLVFNRIDAASNNQFAQQLIETEQERKSIEHQENQILREFLDSIDTSESSKSDIIDNLIQSIEDLTECIQASELNLQESDFAPSSVDSVLDLAPEKTDNSLE